jgi:predicted component of type VI protein secretion system
MASLTIATGELSGQVFELDKDELSIGRSDQNVISLDDPAVSGKHCVVARSGNKYSIRDLHSTNGTRLNGKNVSEARLKPGDVITVGAVDMTIDGAEIEIEPPAPDLDPRVSTTPTVIMTPRSSAGRPAPVAASPGFQTKKDNRALWFVIVAICLILVGAAMAFFLTRVFK